MWDAIVNYAILNDEPLTGATGLNSIDDFDDFEVDDEDIELMELEHALGLSSCIVG